MIAVEGRFRTSNEAILGPADVSARACDVELQVFIADGHEDILAALVFALCDRADRLDPVVASFIDEDGIPKTNRGHVLEPIVAGSGMHLRPFDRRFVIADRWYHRRSGWDHLFGTPIEDDDARRGVSMQIENEIADVYSGRVVGTDEERAEICGYTRMLFAEVVNDVDLAPEVALFAEAIDRIRSSPGS